MPFSRYHRTKYIVRRTVVITHVFNPAILNVIRLEPLRKTQHSRTPNSHRSNRAEYSRKLRPIEVVIECGSRGEPAYYYTPSDYYDLLNELLPEVTRADRFTASQYKHCCRCPVSLFCGLLRYYFSLKSKGSDHVIVQ